MADEIRQGVINIYKEKGYTSHDVVAVVRKTLRGVKTGHTGTLDPQAEGVLPVCVGRATKLAGLLMEGDKTYIAQVLLGVVTDTGDWTGSALTGKNKLLMMDRSAIKNAVSSFVGGYRQTPPMYSAIKINGQKLYQLARKGVTVEREARAVQINSIYIRKFLTAKPLSTEMNAEGPAAENRRIAFPPLDFAETDGMAANALEIEVDCSKGTYIRSLCEDIGAALGCGACMGDLIRARSGRFTRENAVTLDTLKKAAAEDRWAEYLLPAEQALVYPRINIKPEWAARVRNGNPVPLSGIVGPESRPAPDCNLFWLYDGETLIGLFRADSSASELMPEVMMNGPVREP